MKALSAVAVVVAVTLGAAPAFANLVEVTTSVPLDQAHDGTQLAAAVQKAVEEALRDAINFEPTLVALTNAQVIGERLYVRVLAADEEGEQVLGELSGNGAGAPGGGELGSKQVHTRT
jgi:hypothetical protein